MYLPDTTSFLICVDSKDERIAWLYRVQRYPGTISWKGTGHRIEDDLIIFPFPILESRIHSRLDPFEICKHSLTLPVCF